MAAFNKLNQFVADVANGKHNLGSDTLKVALSNTAPAATNAVLADITEISAGNGYTAGGAAVSISSSAQSSGTYKLVASASVTFTASGGSINAFRYAYLYNSTQTSPNKPLIGYWDYGAAVTVTNGNSFLVQFDGTNGILQLA